MNQVLNLLILWYYVVAFQLFQTLRRPPTEVPRNLWGIAKGWSTGVSQAAVKLLIIVGKQI